MSTFTCSASFSNWTNFTGRNFWRSRAVRLTLRLSRRGPSGADLAAREVNRQRASERGRVGL